jgi:internalin A
VDVDDDSAPSTVFDLRVKGVTTSSVTLEWTAPGDADTVGTAASYDVRGSMDFITDQDWDAAYPLSGEPQPSPYGSTETMLVTGLEEDSTYYFALKTRGHSGNWSWISNCAMAVCFDDFEVDFPDAALEEVIRTAVGIPTGPIHRSDLLSIHLVDANDKGISDLTGLQYCVKAHAVFMGQNSVTDLSPLADLVELTHVQMANNQVVALGPLAGLARLEQIIFTNNTIADISALTSLTGLTDVRLGGNQIADITPLQGLPALLLVVLSGNQIVDLAPLVANTGLDNGDVVYLYGNPLSTVSRDTHIPTLQSRGVTVYY